MCIKDNQVPGPALHFPATVREPPASSGCMGNWWLRLQTRVIWGVNAGVVARRGHHGQQPLTGKPLGWEERSSSLSFSACLTPSLLAGGIAARTERLRGPRLVLPAAVIRTPALL